MKLDEYKGMWTIEKEKYALLRLRNGYGIYNQVDKTGVIIEDDEIHEIVINEMLKGGNKIIDRI